MIPPFSHQLRRELETATEQLDREHITIWLMMFAAKKPLKLHHPRMGQITFEGISFYGSVVDVYDRYVLLVIDDLVAETARKIEAALPNLPRQDRAIVVSDGTAAITAAKARLLSRARDIKGAAIGSRAVGTPPPRIAAAINWTPFAERLAHALKSLRLADMNTNKVTQTWFKRYKTALDRMRSADPSEFAMRASRLASVFREPEMLDVRALLTEGLALQPFLDRASSDDVEFGEPFPFPSDPVREIGVAILLLDALAADNDVATSLAANHYDVPGDHRIVASWMNMVDQVYVPLASELQDYLEGQGWLAYDPSPVAASGNTISIHDSTGVTVQQAVSHSNQAATLKVTNADVANVLATFAQLTRPLVEEDRLEEFDADVQTIRAQLAKPQPSVVILREAGSTLRSLCEGVLAGAITPPAQAAAGHLWRLLGL